jgi:hypothetical protein
MFVPSLSWRSDRFYITRRKTRPFSHLANDRPNQLPLDARDVHARHLAALLLVVDRLLLERVGAQVPVLPQLRLLQLRTLRTLRLVSLGLRKLTERLGLFAARRWQRVGLLDAAVRGRRAHHIRDEIGVDSECHRMPRDPVEVPAHQRSRLVRKDNLVRIALLLVALRETCGVEHPPRGRVLAERFEYLVRTH